MTDELTQVSQQVRQVAEQLQTLTEHVGAQVELNGEMAKAQRELFDLVNGLVEGLGRLTSVVEDLQGQIDELN